MPDALTVRTLQDAELRPFTDVVWGAFLADPRGEDVELENAVLEPARSHAVFDGGTIIGGGSILTRSMTMPGAGPVPVAAVTAVGVAPDHRRRGALSLVMRAQLHDLHESGGEPVAALWASEGGIYGRFGYGLASKQVVMTVRRGARLRADVDPGEERVTLVDRDTARLTMSKLHAEYTASRIGGINRPEPAWDWLLADQEHNRGGASALRFAVVSGGYARFRVTQNWDASRHGPEHEIRVSELVSLTPQAHAALWRFLFELDLCGRARYHNTAADDPLQLMLDNPRMAAFDVSDGLYVRLVDVDRALTGRRYAAPLDMVLQVEDELCPWNAGRWRLRVDGSGAAEVTRTDADADLACSTTALGSAYLGSMRISTLAAAGRMRELRPGAVRAATVAFTAEHEPHCLEMF